METWKCVSGYENYLVSNYGRVFSKNVKRVLKP